jgi:hypothetical protein
MDEMDPQVKNYFNMEDKCVYIMDKLFLQRSK